MKNTAIIAAVIGLVGTVGAAFLVSKGSAGPVASPAPTSGTPVSSPASGTPVKAPNQTGVTEVPLDQATSAVNAPGKHKNKHKK